MKRGTARGDRARGQSTVEYAILVGRLAGAKQLALFHHCPSHGDDRMDTILREGIRKVDQGDGVLILADVYGATHTNVACHLLARGRIELITGVNLPMLLRVLNYRHLKMDDLIDKALSGGSGGIAGIAHPQAEIGRHLIVAAARGVQPPGGRADQLRQPRFGDHVDVLKVQVHGHAIGFIFRRDPVQPLGNRLRILAIDDALLGEHRDMRLGPGDILLPQTLVERDGGIYLAHDRRGAGRKPATPHAVGAFSLGTCFARANDTAPGCRSGGLR